MIRTLAGAIQFLTILPVPGRGAAPGRSAAWFPIIGALLGAAGALILEMSRIYLTASLGAVLAVVFWVWIAGALHEDGLADVFDAFRKGRPAERILEILKDSRVGAYGAVALALTILIRWQSLVSLAAIDIYPALMLSQALPRASMVALAWSTQPAAAGLGATFIESLTTRGAILAMAQGVAFAALCGPKAAFFTLAGAALIVIRARRYFIRRIGGVTGDCLGATAQLVEIFVLISFACRSCTS